MQYDDLRQRPIEQLVNEVQSLASVASQAEVQSVAALAARLSMDLSLGLADLTSGVHNAKGQLADRLDKLSKEISETRVVMANAAKEASKHTAALVRWTMVLGVATVLLAASTVWAVLH